MIIRRFLEHYAFGKITQIKVHAFLMENLSKQTINEVGNCN
jgi:hypothetical protein